MLHRAHEFLDCIVLKYIVIKLLLLYTFKITSVLKKPYKQHQTRPNQTKPKCLCLSYLGNKCRQVRMF